MSPDDGLHWLPTVGTDALFPVHATRVGRHGPERSPLYVDIGQRCLSYVRTTTPLPNERTPPKAKRAMSKPAPNIGMPAP